MNELTSRVNTLNEEAKAVLAQCAPLQARVDVLTGEIEDIKAALRPFVLELQKMRAPLVEIENERAAISRALGGRTGLIYGTDAAPMKIEPSARRTATVTETKPVGSASDDTRAHLTPEQIKRLELIEQQNLQAMQALQVLLQVMEDERGKRENLQKIVLRIAEGADDLLKKAG